jgi:hypothetical protein
MESLASDRRRDAGDRFVLALDDCHATTPSWNQPGQWSEAVIKVLGRLMHDAYASLPFVAFLTPPAGRLDSGSIGPALSRPYRRSPLCSLSVSTSSPGIRACSVYPSVRDTSDSPTLNIEGKRVTKGNTPE